MVEEGELKKRIKQLIPAYEDFLLEEGEEPRDTEHIFKILDDAKKEILNGAVWLPSGEIKDVHSTVEVLIVKRQTFVKWFGDEK